MIKTFYLSFAVFLLNLFSIDASAQCTINYLINPSFETPVQANYGNNFPAGTTFGGWSMTNVVPASSNPWNIIKVNGSGYIGGPNTAQDGLQYADVTSAAGLVEQNFTLTCPATVTFSGYYSSREASGYTDWTAQINILNASNTIVATSSTRNFTVADADGTTDAVWYQLSGSAALLPAGNYKFSAVLGNYGNFDNAFLCATPSCIILPVKLKTFEARLSNCNTSLNWTAENETAFSKYIVEYSQNGIDFIEVGSVIGTGSNEYSYFHKPSFGKAFYRLRMVDIDGKGTYSKIVVMNVNCNKSTLVVYPNPVIDFLNISINRVITTTLATASIYDATGRIVLTKQLSNGSNSIDMQKMSPGIYNLVVFDGIHQTNFKIKR